MPDIYREATHVPELNGQVNGGVSVVMHRPDQIDGLLAICELTPRPPDTPLWSVHKALIDPALNLEEWRVHWQSTQKNSTASTAPSNTTEVNESDKIKHDPLESDLLAFKEALKFAQALWRSQPEDEIEQLSCVAMVADHGPPASRKLDIKGDKVMFALHRGSIAANFVKLPLYPTIFCVGFIAGGGATPSARVNGLVRRLRNSAIREYRSTLQDIRTLWLDPASNKPLIVLVHGLFETDVGTFDHLETLLRQDQNVVVAGFPHDSIMTSIDTNGRELAQILADLKLQPGSVRFACHSRGGLVARSAATWLANKSVAPLAVGCATFGTPHSGSPIAESPSAFLAAGVMLTLGKKTRSCVSLLDALSCYAYAQDFPGISDLRPPRTDKTYISDLQKKEGLYPDEHMPMFVVGGMRQPRGWREQLATRLLHGLDHDFVVPIESSLPRLRKKGEPVTVNCDHYSYFGIDQEDTLKKAVTFLTGRQQKTSQSKKET